MPKPVDWFKEFEFDLPSALLRDLVCLLDGMDRALLTAENVDLIPEEQGVYQLFLDDQLVYVGKTDSDAGLNQRLARHARKIQQRHRLEPSRVSFKAVRIFVFTAMDLEQLLIKHYSTSGSLAWNQSGFGANDPGRERDTTALKDEHFDLLYPIDIDAPLGPLQITGTHQVSVVLAKLKSDLPYTIRFQNNGGRSRKPHDDLVAGVVELGDHANTVRHVLRAIRDVLGPEWQITVHPGYVILYKEKKTYPHAREF